MIDLLADKKVSLIDLLADEEVRKQNSFKNNTQACLSHPVVQDLLQTERKESEPAHKLYSIHHINPRHEYVVEKKWEGTNTVSYKIHHSWIYAFSFGEWEDSAPWPHDPQNPRHFVRQRFEPYRQRALNAKEIENLLIEMINWCNEVFRNKTPYLYQSFGDNESEAHLQSIIYCFLIAPNKLHEFNKRLSNVSSSSSNQSSSQGNETNQLTPQP